MVSCAVYGIHGGIRYVLPQKSTFRDGRDTHATERAQPCPYTQTPFDATNSVCMQAACRTQRTLNTLFSAFPPPRDNVRAPESTRSYVSCAFRRWQAGGTGPSPLPYTLPGPPPWFSFLPKILHSGGQQQSWDPWGWGLPCFESVGRTRRVQVGGAGRGGGVRRQNGAGRSRVRGNLGWDREPQQGRGRQAGEGKEQATASRTNNESLP